MAERRMFSKTVIDSDNFLEMPASSQLLYFYLALHADDDGFVNKPRSLARLAGAQEQDLRLLIQRQFLIDFDSGIVVICHWKMHNTIRKDAYNPTKYTRERAMLELDSSGVYRLLETPCDDAVTESLQVCDGTVAVSETQVRLGKDRSGKDRSGKDREAEFPAPALAEIRAYCQSRASPVDAQGFFDYYTANGWMAGKEKIKDWKAMIRVWERREPKKKGTNPFLEMAVNG